MRQFKNTLNPYKTINIIQDMTIEGNRRKGNITTNEVRQYKTRQSIIIKYKTTQYKTIQYNTTQESIWQTKIIQCKTTQHNIRHM